MNIHNNARLTPLRRGEMAREVLSKCLSISEASEIYGVSQRTVSKWTKRYRHGGQEAMQDKSSRPDTSPRRIAQSLERAIIKLRRERLCGRHIAKSLSVSTATVSRVLRRAGLSRVRDLEPPKPIVRYERARAGELLHLDIKKLGRFDRPGHRVTGNRAGQSRQRSNGTAPGWEYVHVCVDDNSRLSFSQIHPDETAASAVKHLRAAARWYGALGVRVERVMTDNGACYKSHLFAKTCQSLGIKHIRTKPYTPQTNGKAERFIQTALREWAYARSYQSSDERAQYLSHWTHMYNWHRPHGGISFQTPISRLNVNPNNLLMLHI